MPTSGRRPPATSSDRRRSADRRGRNRRPYREHAPHIGVADDDRERPGIERGRKAVEDAVVRVLGLDRRAVERESRDHLALRRRGRRPSRRAPAPRCDAARRGDPARRATASRGRRSSGRRAVLTAGRRAGSPSPAGFPRAGRRRSPPQREGARRPRAPRRRCLGGDPTPRETGLETRQPTHTHPRSGLGGGQGIGEARRRRDHRRVVGAEHERRERRIGQSGPELRVRRHPPTTAICSIPDCSAASRSRCVRARTIARW